MWWARHNLIRFENENGAGAGASGAGAGNAGKSLPELLAELAAANIERTKLKEANDKLTTEIGQVRGETPKLVEQAVAAEAGKRTALQQRIVDAELRAQAAAAGLQDPDLLGHQFFDRTKITVDDNGVVAGVKEMFDGVKAKKPDWFKAAAAGAGAGAAAGGATGGAAPGAGGAGGSGAAGAKKVSEMNKAEYEEFKRTNLRSLRTG